MWLCLYVKKSLLLLWYKSQELGSCHSLKTRPWCGGDSVDKSKCYKSIRTWVHFPGTHGKSQAWCKPVTTVLGRAETGRSLGLAGQQFSSNSRPCSKEYNREWLSRTPSALPWLNRFVKSVSSSFLWEFEKRLFTTDRQRCLISSRGTDRRPRRKINMICLTCFKWHQCTCWMLSRVFELVDWPASSCKASSYRPVFVLE